MVYYDGQDVDLQNYLEYFINTLKKFDISENDINFIINLTPVTIGCNFYVFNIHNHIKNMNPIYELDLSYLDFHDYSLKGIIQIEDKNTDSFLAKNVNYYNKKMANFILLPKNYYIRFEKECIINIIINELTINNVSLCNLLCKKFNHTRDELQSFLINRDNCIIESIYNFVDIIFKNEKKTKEIKIEFFDDKDEETLDIIFNNNYCQFEENYVNNRYYNNKKRKRFV